MKELLEGFNQGPMSASCLAHKREIDRQEREWEATATSEKYKPLT